MIGITNGLGGGGDDTSGENGGSWRVGHRNNICNGMRSAIYGGKKKKKKKYGGPEGSNIALDFRNVAVRRQIPTSRCSDLSPDQFLLEHTWCGRVGIQLIMK